MAYQSLYRRYRPQKFSEIRGQRHVIAALQNAVVKGEVGHAYLLHGPRGTGKTTSARVLAKALNCENLGADGEPCGECESCVAIENGRSFDLHELDAASNNKVEDMRDLLGKVNLGNPGRAKVYILDEAHMLTAQAENALLKTLEEPPDHVTWVLATTEPHKVVDTIRSRCQVFELSLLAADEMVDHVRWVINDAELEVDDAAVDYVVAAGGGSVRDTLSALDRVVAAGGTVEIDTSTDLVLDALGRGDVAAALAAVGDATGRGRDPRTIGESVLAGLRDAFLTEMGSPPPRITDSQKERAEHLRTLLSPAEMTRALETLGVSLVAMRQAPDPRVDLEVALVRLCRPAADPSLDAVKKRLDRIERQLVGATPTGSPSSADTPTSAPPPVPAIPASAPPPVPAIPASAPPPVPAIPALATATAAVRPSSAKQKPGLGNARRVLAEKRGSSDPPPPVPVPAAPPPAIPPPIPAAIPADSTTADLRRLRPATPTEVVELAKEHLGLSRGVVTSRAKEELGPTPPDGRTPEDLARFWLGLVDEARPTPAPSPPPQPTPPPAPEPVPEQVPVPEPEPETVDIDDLVDAPSHIEKFTAQVLEAFPGTEVLPVEEQERP